MKFIFLIASIALLPVFLKAEYSKFEWDDLGSPQVDFYKIDVLPMPIIQPGDAIFNFRANLKRGLNGKLRTVMDIVRTVSGLALPIRCYLSQGVYVGSCTYDDLCTVIEAIIPNNFNPTDCLPELLDYGIDCTCPMKVKAGLVDLVDILLDLPDASQSIATFLASGDFVIKIDTSDALGKYANVVVRFSVKPKPTGK